MKVSLLLFLAACQPSTGEDDSATIDTDTDTDTVLPDADGDGSPNREDCADHNADVYPGADERANGIDDDCDGVVDDPVYAGSADAILRGANAEDGFGSGAVWIDGVLWVGVPGSDISAENEGRLYGFPGPFSGELTPADANAEIRGDHDGDELGASLFTFDFEGDDLLEVAASLPGTAEVDVFNPRFTGVASAHVAILRLHGGGINDRFGTAVVGADLDGNGTTDIAVSAPLADGVGGAKDADAGAVYLAISPGVNAELDLPPAARGPFRDAYVGASMVGADVDGDGITNLVVGAPIADFPGRVYLLDSDPPADIGDAPLWFEGGLTADLAGTALDAADLDGDGRDDVAIGAPGLGRVWICYGSPNATTQSHVLADAELTDPDGGRLGSSVAIVDPDGDGVLDVAAAEDAGRVRFYRGPFLGSQTLASMVIEERSGGDLTIDGEHDLLLMDPTDAGITWIFEGWEP